MLQHNVHTSLKDLFCSGSIKDVWIFIGKLLLSPTLSHSSNMHNIILFQMILLIKRKYRLNTDRTHEPAVSLLNDYNIWTLSALQFIIMNKAIHIEPLYIKIWMNVRVCPNERQLKNNHAIEFLFLLYGCTVSTGQVRELHNRSSSQPSEKLLLLHF